MTTEDALAEALRLLQKAALQVDRVMQSWHDEEWEALATLGIHLGDWDDETIP